jgi:hypothetical protein
MPTLDVIHEILMDYKDEWSFSELQWKLEAPPHIKIIQDIIQTPELVGFYDGREAFCIAFRRIPSTGKVVRLFCNRNNWIFLKAYNLSEVRSYWVSLQEDDPSLKCFGVKSEFEL